VSDVAADKLTSSFLSEGVLRQWRGQAIDRIAVDGQQALLRIAEIDRALGDLSGAAERFQSIDSPYAQAMANLLRGKSWDARTNTASPFFLVKEFLDEATLADARNIVAAKRDGFAVAGVGSDEEARIDLDTRVAHHAGASKRLREMLLPRIEDTLRKKDVEAFLASEPVSVPNAEMVIVTYPQGGKYLPHRDEYGQRTRRLTAVVYLHKEPRRFRGGDLLLHDEASESRKDADWFTRYIPVGNSIIFFPARCLHEVTRVYNETDDPLEGRMAINVWMHGLHEAPSAGS